MACVQGGKTSRFYLTDLDRQVFMRIRRQGQFRPDISGSGLISGVLAVGLDLGGVARPVRSEWNRALGGGVTLATGAASDGPRSVEGGKVCIGRKLGSGLSSSWPWPLDPSLGVWSRKGRPMPPLRSR